MDQITHDVRRNSWLSIIKQCQARPEGITVKQWLDDNGIKNEAYYYWLRKFRKEAYEEMNPPKVTGSSEVSFAEIHMPMQQLVTLLKYMLAIPLLQFLNVMAFHWK